MSRGPRSFRQRDLKTALLAAKEAGVDVERVKIDLDARTITLEMGGKSAVDELNNDEWDVVLPMGDGRHA
jgi:hypothetical protein